MKRISEWFKGLCEQTYTVIIPVLASVGCFILRKMNYSVWFTGENYADALGSVIAAVAIIISLFGVMLTLLAEAKHTSTIVERFFRYVDRESFVRQLKSCIGVGFLSIIMSTVMFFVKTNTSLFSICFFSAWFGCLISLFCRAYRFIALIIEMLFIGQNDDKGKRKAERELREKQANDPNSNIEFF